MPLTDLTDTQLVDVHEGIHVLNDAGRYDEALTKAHELVTIAAAGRSLDLEKASAPSSDDEHKFVPVAGKSTCKDCGKSYKEGCHTDMGKSLDDDFEPDVGDERWIKRVAKSMVSLLKAEVDGVTDIEDTDRPFV